jgi:1,2-phenylacetyl-CoA epoxidase catalytic subunit
MTPSQTSWWRGRPLRFDPDGQAIEQERQRWVTERIGSLNELTVEQARDPRAEYDRHRDNYVTSGDRTELALMLEYVR